MRKSVGAPARVDQEGTLKKIHSVNLCKTPKEGMIFFALLSLCRPRPLLPSDFSRVAVLGTVISDLQDGVSTAGGRFGPLAAGHGGGRASAANGRVSNSSSGPPLPRVLSPGIPPPWMPGFHPTPWALIAVGAPAFLDPELDRFPRSGWPQDSPGFGDWHAAVRMMFFHVPKAYFQGFRSPKFLIFSFHRANP